MTQKITQAAEVDLSIKGGQNVKSIKQELREAREEAFRLTREFGEFSPEAVKAQAQFAKLKDDMEDFGHRVNALNPDKFTRIATVATAASHGFSAASGAAALFGAESEKVQQAMLRVQGAMALSQGLAGINDSRQALGALAAQVKGPLVKAFTGLRGALMATGLGALAVGVGLLIANFDKVKEKVGRLIAAVPGLSAVVNALADAWDWVTDKLQEFTDAVGITDSKLDAHIEKLQKTTQAAKDQAEIDEALGKNTYEQRRKIIQMEIKQLELQHANEKDINAKRQELRVMDAKQQKQISDEKLKQEEEARAAEKAAQEKATNDWLQKSSAARQAQLQISQDLRKSQMTEREAELYDLKVWYQEQSKVLQAGGQKLTDLNQLYREKENKLRDDWRAEDLKKQEEEAKKAEELRKKKHDDAIKAAQEEYDRTQESTDQHYSQERLDLTRLLETKQITREEFGQKTTQLELSRLETAITNARDYGQSTLSLEQQLADARIANADAVTQAEINNANKQREARQMILESSLQSVQALGQLLINEQGKADKFNRAFALAQIATDTAQAISALVRNSESNPANSVTFGAAGAAQFISGMARILANIAKAKQLIKGAGAAGGAVGGGAGTTSQGGGAAPQFTQRGQDIRVQTLSQGTSRNTQDTGQTQSIPVVEYDNIRRVERRVKVIEGEGVL